ncbi:phasin family protein [Rhizobium lusitanum]|uniref:phasin family protein n=1 Tax=Rhizobium lusitanum TaxID=293958 RepID=UPI001614F13B|nr:phasin family protein [Rhizobium lusitanum]QND47074.1 phasin family protein [Rhizobium lusitanum]
MFNFDEANNKGKEAIDTALKNYSEVNKGFQAIAAETAEYSKKSFQDGVSHFETLAGVKSFEAVFELQSSFVKSSYESFVAEATKLGEMYADLAKTAYKPFEAPIAAATKATGKAVASVAPAA